MRYILWSGGWDSTYLLCKRARESDETIQPVYISFKHGSEVNERKVKKTLLSIIRGKSDIKAKINDVIEIRSDALPENEEYEKAYEECKKAIVDLYGEHNLFYLFGKASILFPNIEIGIEAPPPGTRENDIGRFAKLLSDNGISVDSDGNTDCSNASDAFKKVLGNMRYPILYISEVKMISDAKEWGYFDDVFQNTWSCYSSMDTVCGVCRSCEVKWLSGDAFSFRFDDQARKNHEIKEYLKSIDAEQGTNYAEYFTHYIMNGNWVTIDSANSSQNSSVSMMSNTEDEDSPTNEQIKSQNLMSYFSYLKNNWPNAKDINAPTI